VLLAGGAARAALPVLRDATARWRELEAPYQVATARALLGLACRGLDDREGAELEFDAAREEFERLGALPDLERLSRLMRVPVASAAGNLTIREREVLACLATGKTNRAIAETLYISEKTVARHLSNIFTKLNLATRAEATAYAYQHDLVR
jgi:DNA-binding CsgD family transcriptional regulator